MAPPSKKKPVLRKQVLDFKNDADSSQSKSSWQSKYQELLPSSPSNSENGIVGNYNSDSDGRSRSPIDTKIRDFMKELESGDTVPGTKSNGSKKSSDAYPVPKTAWLQCFDQGTGYPYYWNQVTNEVSWQPPHDYLAAVQILQKQQQMAAAAKIAQAEKQSAQPAIKPALKKKVPDKTDKKPRKRYPWEDDSDDEKIELITSYGSESETDEPLEKKPKKNSKSPPKKVEKAPEEACIRTEFTPDVYETSSLMTPLVADTGPPGIEPMVCDSGEAPKPKISDMLSNLKSKASQLAKHSAPVLSESEKIDKIISDIEKMVPPDLTTAITPAKKKPKSGPSSFSLIASYGDDSDVDDDEDDADSNASGPKSPTPAPAPPSTPCLFPAAANLEVGTGANEVQSVPTPLFPCVSETEESQPPVVPVPQVESAKEISKPNSPAATAFTLLESDVPNKGMKRKRRIEFATTKDSEIVKDFPGPIVSTTRLEAEEFAPVKESNPKYNMDPTSGYHRGFGFSDEQTQAPRVDKKYNKGIQFVKGETINKNVLIENKEKTSRSNSPVPSEDLLDGAALLREKLIFLGEGKEEVSAVQQMAIQLETLLTAWQSGALTPTYLCQWLGTRAIELSKNEQDAAPPGWICEWEREEHSSVHLQRVHPASLSLLNNLKSSWLMTDTTDEEKEQQEAKRYQYRNKSSGVVVWEYPQEENVEEEETAGEKTDHRKNDVQEEVEMELSNTPPRLSSPPLDSGYVSGLVPPPPPVISRSQTPPPPPPPSIAPPQPVPPPSSAIEKAIFVPPPPPDAYPPPPPEPDEPPPPGVDEMELGPRITRQQVSEGSNHKRNLTSELDSFYSDLAKLDPPEPAEDVPQVEIQTHQPPMPSFKAPERPTTPPTTETSKRKKKGKMTPGLTLKKKGVSNLVAKWQQVREEARRTYSSDDEDAEQEV